MNPIIKLVIVGVAAMVGWAIGSKVDGPIAQWLIAGLAAWLAFKHF